MHEITPLAPEGGGRVFLCGWLFLFSVEDSLHKNSGI